MIRYGPSNMYPLLQAKVSVEPTELVVTSPRILPMFGGAIVGQVTVNYDRESIILTSIHLVIVVSTVHFVTRSEIKIEDFMKTNKIDVLLKTRRNLSE